MSNLNQVTLQGNLVDTPRIMGEESNVARFTIAVNNGFGERRSTTFVDCVAFGGQAGVIGKHLSKGKQVIVRGMLVQNNWTDDEGNKRSKLEVRLENVNGFFFTGNAGGNGGAAAAEGGEEAEAEAAAATAGGGDGEKLF